jgi:ABC-type polysaccharide/polyol phosphate transport system ATPase subunit
MLTMNTTIRAVNPGLWKELKVEAVMEGLTIGEAVNHALEKWLHEHKKKAYRKKHKSFWDLEPIKFKGKDAKKLSMKIDKVLYG